MGGDNQPPAGNSEGTGLRARAVYDYQAGMYRAMHIHRELSPNLSIN